ncbi:MAG: alcohol dehydrogenase catalytic domain-containing protein [Candidatus Marinimicrobia bacterium]|nr:alcohol dehydrogenase catalytic domain-containing protein [Candidatus Neomarinimicrobiota bacterium]
MLISKYDGPTTMSVAEAPERARGPGEVRIRVAYCGLCGTDMHIFHGKMDKRVAQSQTIGHEMSGIVAAVGAGVTRVAPGAQVTVRPLAYCGTCGTCRAGHVHICENLKFMGIDTPGALQEYWTVPEGCLHVLPEGLALEQAALIEPLAVACHDVRRGEVKAGEQVVVIGGGPIGLLIALVARAAGADVRLSEISPGRIALAEELGLRTINPKEQDLVAEVKAWTGGPGADVVFEVTATAAGAAVMTELARPRGRLVVVGIFSAPVAVDLFKFFWRELDLRGARVYAAEDFEEAIRLAAAGALPLERLISATFPLKDIAQAFQFADEHKDAMKTLVQCNQQ